MFLLSRHSPLFRRIGWIAVLALLLPMMVGLVHHPAGAIAKPIAHCSAMHVSDKAAKGGQKFPANNAPSCPLCQTLQLLNGGFVAPENLVLLQVYHEQKLLTPEPTAFLVLPFRHSNARPRAPPSFA